MLSNTLRNFIHFLSISQKTFLFVLSSLISFKVHSRKYTAIVRYSGTAVVLIIYLIMSLSLKSTSDLLHLWTNDTFY